MITVGEKFDRLSRSDRWDLKDGKLIFHHPEMEIFWVVPGNYTMPSLHVLGLAEFVYLTPFKERVELEIPIQEPPLVLFDEEAPSNEERKIPTIGGRKNVGVAFSGGVDSSAVLQLLPSCIPIYTQVANPTGMHKIENALLSVKEVNGVAIISNCDELPTVYGKTKGYYGDAGFTTTGILFSEYYDLHTLADGNVLESMYLYGPHGHGTKFRSKDLGTMMRAFRGTGLEYCVPCAGLTEVLTTRIAEESGLKYSMGCMRGEHGMPCNNCLKCFRKRGLQGDPLPTNKEVERKLNTAYIPMLPSLLWARDNNGLSHPRIDDINLDISWVDKWFAQSLEYMPESLRGYFLDKLLQYGIEELETPQPLFDFTSQTNFTHADP